MYLYEIASALGQTAHEVEERLTHSEYMEWLAFFQIKEKKVNKTELYLANLARIVSVAMGSKRDKLRDYMFGENEESEEELAEREKLLQAKLMLFAGDTNAFFKEQK